MIVITLLLLLVAAVFVFAGWVPALVVCLAMILLYLAARVWKNIPMLRNYAILIAFVVIFFALFLAVKMDVEPEQITSGLEGYYEETTQGWGLNEPDEKVWYCNESFPIHVECIQPTNRRVSTPNVTEGILGSDYTISINRSKISSIPSTINDSVGSWSKTKDLLKPVGIRIRSWFNG